MRRANPQLARMVAMHVLRTSVSIDFLRGSRRNEKVFSLSEALRYFVDHTGALNALLNEEPIYIAGDILGQSSERIDALPESRWQKYREGMTHIAKIFEEEKDSKFLELVGVFVSVEDDREAEYFLEEIKDADFDRYIVD